MIDIEAWAPIRDHSRYQVSSEGRIYNLATEREMSVSQNNFGHLKISLYDDEGNRRTRSVAVLVAEAFVEQPTVLADHVIHLNGDQHDVRAENLAWRPRWFAWKYTNQLGADHPHYYRNLRVYNIRDDVEYENIIHAGMAEGLLFEHIWQSTYTGNPVFPNGSIWTVRNRV